MVENRWDWQPGRHLLLQDSLQAISVKAPKQGVVYTLKEVYVGDSGRPYVRLKEVVGGYLAVKFKPLQRLTPESFRALTPEGSP